MPDITKGYTFSDSKADWASQKDTALRLNKMVDDAKVNLVAGTNVTISRGSNGITINSTASGSGTVTNVSVVSANGLNGTVATATTTPAITLSTTVSGIVKGNGTALSAATAGTDYQAPITLTTTGTSGAATFTSNTLNIPQYAGGGSGTVTSVAGTGTVSGVSLTGTVTTSGNLTLGGTLAVTPSNFASQTANNVLAAPNGSSGIPTFRALVAADVPTLNQNTTGSAGTATALATARAINGVNFDGTSAITVTAAGSTLSDTVPITKGGTGQITANTALNALLPSQAGASGKNLQTDGTNTSWVASSGSGTVTAVSVTTVNGVSGTVSNPNTTPAISLTLGAVTPTSVNGVVFSGSSSPTLSVTGTSSVQGTNTGDNAVNSNYSGLVTNANHTGDATGSGALTLATVNTTTGSFTAANITVNAKGLITSASNGAPTTIQVTNDETTATDHYPVFMPGGSSPYSAGAKVSGAKMSFRPSTGKLTSIEYVGNVSSATVTGAATGSTSRTLSACRGDVFNVKDFGARGDNSASPTDDYAAFLAAITAQQAASSGAVVYVPSGTYLLNTRLVISNSRPLVIIGDGQSSRISAAGAGGFLKATASASFANHEFRDLRISCSAASSTAIETIGSPTTSSHEQKQLYVHNVVFDYGTVASWAKCLLVTAANNGVISDCVFRGTVSGSNGTGKGIELVGFTVNLAITNCSFFAWEYGIYCPSYQEGLFVTGCFIIQVKFGVYYASNDASILTAGSFVTGSWYQIETSGSTSFTSIGAANNSVGTVFQATGAGSGTGTASGLRSTQLIMNSTHIDARGSGSAALWAYNAANVLVSGCYFICDSGTYTVYLQRCFESAFTGNMIYGATTYGIYLANGPSSLSCIAVSIYGNAFRGPTTDIYADTNAVMIRAQGNVKAPSSNTSMTVTYISSGGRTADNDIQTT